MNGFNLRIWLDNETGLATAELSDADGVPFAKAEMPLDGTERGFMTLFVTTQQMAWPCWDALHRQWHDAWGAAATKEITTLLDSLAKELGDGV